MMIEEIIIANWERPQLFLNDCILGVYNTNDSAEDVGRWISGRKYNREGMFAMATSNLLEIIHPFLYVTDHVLPYVLGVYLLILVDHFRDDLPVDLPVIHYTYFIRDPRFLVAFERLDFSQRWLVFIITKRLLFLLRTSLNYGEESFITSEQLSEIEVVLDSCSTFQEK